MTRARDIANLVDANGDIVAGALDNVPAADLVNDTTPQLGGNLDAQSNNITSVGNLGVGTASPSLTTEISGSFGGLAITNTTTTAGTTNLQQSYSGGTAELRIGSNTNANTSSAMFIKSGDAGNVIFNGNVGIGTTSPVSLIDGRLSGTSSGEVLSVGNTGSGVFGGIAVSDGGTYPVRHWGSSLEFYTGNSVYSSATERMKIDSSGRVTMPYQPAFRAVGNSSTYYSISSLGGAGTYIPFATVTTNTGSHYNNSTYKFTAPVSGMYHFSYNIYTRTGTSVEDIYARWTVNNTSYKGYTYWYNTTGSEIHHTLTDSMSIYLNANDFIGVTINGNGNSDVYLGSNEAVFSGFLIG